MPIESAQRVAYSVRGGACEIIRTKLVDEGFDVEIFEPKSFFEGSIERTTDFIATYDAILYVANLSAKSNQTTVRIEWAQPMGANGPHYLASIPTIFVSIENPYHLIDVPRVKTFINTYTPTTTCWTRSWRSFSAAHRPRDRAPWMPSVAGGPRGCERWHGPGRLGPCAARVPFAVGIGGSG